jgi:hypothetical protein
MGEQVHVTVAWFSLPAPWQARVEIFSLSPSHQLLHVYLNH